MKKHTLLMSFVAIMSSAFELYALEESVDNANSRNEVGVVVLPEIIKYELRRQASGIVGLELSRDSDLEEYCSYGIPYSYREKFPAEMEKIDLLKREVENIADDGQRPRGKCEIAQRAFVLYCKAIYSRMNNEIQDLEKRREQDIEAGILNEVAYAKEKYVVQTKKHYFDERLGNRLESLNKWAAECGLPCLDEAINGLNAGEEVDPEPAQLICQNAANNNVGKPENSSSTGWWHHKRIVVSTIIVAVGVGGYWLYQKYFAGLEKTD